MGQDARDLASARLFEGGTGVEAKVGVEGFGDERERSGRRAATRPVAGVASMVGVMVEDGSDSWGHGTVRLASPSGRRRRG